MTWLFFGIEEAVTRIRNPWLYALAMVACGLTFVFAAYVVTAITAASIHALLKWVLL